MSKQEVYDLLYEIMETLPSELILLIREYMFFLPLTEEIRYFEKGLSSINIVPLSTNRIILHDSERLVLIENDEIKIHFRFNDISKIYSLARYNDVSFIAAHENIIDKITISPNITKEQLIKVEDNMKFCHMHTDNDGCILASGWDGIYVISQGTIIQHLFTGQNCSSLRNDNTLSVYYNGLLNFHCKLFKNIENIYRHECLDELPMHISSSTDNFSVRTYDDILSIKSDIISDCIFARLPSRILDNAIFHNKIYVLADQSVHVFHEKLVTDDDLLKRQQNADT